MQIIGRLWDFLEKKNGIHNLKMFNVIKHILYKEKKTVGITSYPSSCRKGAYF